MLMNETGVFMLLANLCFVKLKECIYLNNLESSIFYIPYASLLLFILLFFLTLNNLEHLIPLINTHQTLHA